MTMDAIERALNIAKACSTTDAKKVDACEIELWLSFFFDESGRKKPRNPQ